MTGHKPGRMIYGPTLFTEFDIYLFKEGNAFRLYEKLGSRSMSVDGCPGIYFAVWAPNAEQVSVLGDFNDWKAGQHPLAVRWDGSGIWEGFLPGLKENAKYKYHITSRIGTGRIEKGDPFAYHWELSPRTASVVWNLSYDWNDTGWMESRARANSLHAPLSIYEVHMGSWRRDPGAPARLLTYREIAPQLTAYLVEMGFTHVEFLPIMEHPFYGSWGYQTVGYFAPTSRYGTPQDFMFLIDHLHQQGIGVILDWVPSHFPSDAHGLSLFDGSHLFEYSDPRKGFHPDWKSLIFNYGRNEVRNFLVSSAMFWLDKYHVDGLRLDAVASMLYLDYSRENGEWIPNEFGGRENLEAISFIKKLNEVVYQAFPDVQTMAEESTAWPMVTRPVHTGGLGFGLKWNMGWMHDTLEYLSKDPVHRKHHHDRLTFNIWYAFSENFLLPLSHDEVVHEKASLLEKMPGDDWQKFASLRLLLGMMYTQPGKKLLFMGGEFGQRREWDHEASLDWHLLDNPHHRGVQNWVRDLNALYKRSPALFDLDTDSQGFEWIDFNDWEKSIISFIRKGREFDENLAVVCNFTPIPRKGYRVGMVSEGHWKEILNSDAEIYGGSGLGNMGGVRTEPVPIHGRSHSLELILPPLSLIVFQKDGETEVVRAGSSRKRKKS